MVLFVIRMQSREEKIRICFPRRNREKKQRKLKDMMKHLKPESCKQKGKNKSDAVKCQLHGIIRCRPAAYSEYSPNWNAGGFLLFSLLFFPFWWAGLLGVFGDLVIKNFRRFSEQMKYSKSLVDFFLGWRWDLGAFKK